MNITFGSVCSGIEAASVAWNPLGWRAAWLAEIEANPSIILAHHYPDVPNLGDMTKIPQLLRNGDIPAPDVFCGGTPCQAFSVAGLRNSLDDARGNLSLKFCDIANEIDIQRAANGLLPCTIFWENVPGVLSTKDNAFGCFLGQLAGEDCALVPPGGKWPDAGAVLGPQRAIAWRILDAQYFGVAQRRRRVFVVASARQGFDPAAVLFEFDGVRRDSAPRREPRQDITHDLAPCLTSSGRGVERTGETRGQDPVVACFGGGNTNGSLDVAACLTAKGQRIDFEVETFAVQPSGIGSIRYTAEVTGTLTNAGGHAYPGTTLQDASAHLMLPYDAAVRRLTPRECEKLQGFPPDYTLVPMPDRRSARKEGDRRTEPRMMADGPRYKALGNSWAVPVVHWIGERIDAHLAQLGGA